MGVAGTDVAMETADIVLMSDVLFNLPYWLAENYVFILSLPIYGFPTNVPTTGYSQHCDCPQVNHQ